MGATVELCPVRVQVPGVGWKPGCAAVDYDVDNIPLVVSVCPSAVMQVALFLSVLPGRVEDPDNERGDGIAGGVSVRADVPPTDY